MQYDFDSLAHLIIGVIIDGRLTILCILSLITLVLGVCAAFKRGDFAWSYLANWASSKVMGRIIPWLCAAELMVIVKTALVGIIPEIVPVGFDVALYGTIVTSFVAEGLTSLQDLGVMANAHPLLVPKPKRHRVVHHKPPVSQVPPLPGESQP